MKLTTTIAMRVVSILLLLACAISAQQPKKTASLTMDDFEARRDSVGTLSAQSTDALALLPPSDLVAVVDVQRAFKLLMPSLNSLAPNELLEVKKKLDEFMNKTGIDPMKISNVTIGFSLSGGSDGKGGGAVIVQGAELNLEKITAAMRAEKIVFKTVGYQGKTLLTGTFDPKTLGNGTLSSVKSKAETMALAALDGQGLVLGDVASVKSVLDAQSGARQGFPNALHAETLGITNSSGLVRFSAVLTESFRQSLREQGGIASPLAAVRLVAGSLSIDEAGEGGMSLDFRLRTSSAKEAAQLDTTLKGFVTMGKSFLAGGDEKAGKLIGDVLDQIRIGVEDNDTTLSLTLPKSLLDRFKQEFQNASAKRNVATR